MQKTLVPLGIRNPKKVLMDAIQRKVDEQGDLRRAFDISMEYPSRETYEHSRDNREVTKRRIVIKQLSNSVSRFAIGDSLGGGYDEETNKVVEYFGWVDNYQLEISVWTTDSEDRDNITELIKLWMLELLQDVRSGNSELGLPYFFANDIFSIRFIRAYEGVNHKLRVNGPVYISNLVYMIDAPFFHQGDSDDLERYKAIITARIVACLKEYDDE